MTKKFTSLTVLFIITVVMVLLMLVTIYRSDDKADELGLLFPELFEQLSEIDNIQFSGTEGQFSLNREGENWYLEEHHNYLANFDEVKRMLIDLSEATLLEKKTDNPEFYPVLGVEGAPSEVEGGSSLQVVFMNDDEQVAGLILGKPREINAQMGPQQVYVRRVGEKQSWLAEGYLYISEVMLNWIQTEVINLARERIARVEITQPDGNSAVLINLGHKDKFGMPETREDTVFKYEQLGYDIAGSLHQLRMEDVVPASEFERGDAEVVTATFTTFDGLVIISKTSFIDGFYFTTLKANYDAAATTEAPEDIQKLDVLKTADEVKKEVAEMNERLSPWVYRVSGFVGTNLMRARADIVTEQSNVIPMPIGLPGLGSP